MLDLENDENFQSVIVHKVICWVFMLWRKYYNYEFVSRHKIGTGLLICAL